MNDATIADASREFLALIDVLDSAYWEASVIQNKDAIYDILSVIQNELAELNKLSIQDHGYAYEMVTDAVRTCSQRLHNLQDRADTIVERTSTQHNLKRCLKNVISIVDQKSGRFG